jgi:hypothetical protein
MTQCPVCNEKATAMYCDGGTEECEAGHLFFKTSCCGKIFNGEFNKNSMCFCLKLNRGLKPPPIYLPKKKKLVKPFFNQDQCTIESVESFESKNRNFLQNRFSTGYIPLDINGGSKTIIRSVTVSPFVSSPFVIPSLSDVC